MMLVNSKALANSADTTSITMVDLLPLGVIKKLALSTEVPCKLDVAGPAMACNGLVVVPTLDATNLLSRMAIYLMVLLLVMTASAGIIVAAALCTNPALPAIMLTTSCRTLSREVTGVLGGWGCVAIDMTLTSFREEVMNALCTLGIGKLGVLLYGSDSFAECCRWARRVRSGFRMAVGMIVMMVIRGLVRVHGRMAFAWVRTLKLGLFRKLRATALAGDGRGARGRSDGRCDEGQCGHDTPRAGGLREGSSK